MYDSAVPASGTCVDQPILDPGTLLGALGQASYEWCLETDRLAWGAGASTVLGVRAAADIANGRAFARLIDLDRPGGRHEAILQSPHGGTTEGAPYCLRYSYRPHAAGRKRWIEDRGRWFAGPDGRPVVARGMVRVVAECPEDETATSAHTVIGIHDRVFAAALADACAAGRQAGLFLATIDQLGALHGAFGAVVADRVCAQVMRGLRGVLRIGDSLTSIADGKFAVMLPGCRAEDIRAAAERFQLAIDRVIVEAEAGMIRPTISIGAVHIAPSAETAGTALHAAQQALDRCERETPGGIAIFAEGDHQAASANAAQRLALALNEDRVFLGFEPVLAAQAAGRQAFRARAFIRMPGNGATSASATLQPASLQPASLQPAWLTPACDRALVRRLALRLVDLAGAVLGRHPGVELILPLPVVVDPRRGPGDSFERLTIELDEALAKADLDNNGRYCRAIRASGARLGIGGFGGGHLDFAELQALEVRQVTLNGVLVEMADQVAQGRFALRSLIETGARQGLDMAAEWVDDEIIARQLVTWGCSRVMGTAAGSLRLELPRLRDAGRQAPMALTGT
ncbi:bifunctional diguanylate cyclase/phosphodiesterase [Labrys neptuniae]|uniref:EAL domain-containing protein n=1 Tax=Labrys neptuniae TaxID=376174 RepID=A0ABV3PIR2_9HYPH